MTRALLNNQGYQVLLKSIDQDTLRNIKTDLTVKIINEDYNYRDQFYIYTLLKDRIIIPQDYGVNKFGMVDYKDQSIQNFEQSQLIFKKQLRDEQIQIVDQITQLYSTGEQAIQLCLFTGFGKTIVSIYIISQIIRGKTLILVHKDILLQQWKEQIESCVDNVKINLIRGSNSYSPLQCNEDVYNKKKYFYDSDIDICMLQTVSKSSYQIDKKYASQYKAIIIDESHHISSKVFSNSLLKFNAPYKLFLSATPDRKDGLEYVCQKFIGNIRIKANEQQQVQHPNVDIYKYHSKVFYPIYIGNENFCSNKLNLSKMITQLTSLEDRTEFIVDIIKNTFLENPRRRILVLSERKLHTINIYSQLQSYFKKTLDSPVPKLQQFNTKNQNQEKFGDIIISTYQLVQEGFDCPYLNTLVLATPKTSITQAIGRIMRKAHDLQPLVIDIFDDFSVYKRYFYKRRKIYKDKDLQVQFIDQTSTSTSSSIVSKFENLDLSQESISNTES